MLTYLHSNLFTSPAQTLVNTVNIVGVMGKGIALEFKTLYPEMYQLYRKQCKSGQFTIGKLFIYRTHNKIIVNFPTKKHWRNPSRVEYIEKGLAEFVKQYNDYGITSVSFPQVGCGNGELDWKTQVQPLMEEYLKPLPIPVYIHIYPTAANFVPERLDPQSIQDLQQQREIIPFSQVWADVVHLLSMQNSQNGDTEAAIFDEWIQFSSGSQHPIRVYRQDLEDLWTTLRVTGTVSGHRIPEPIRADGATEIVFDLLLKLPYIDTIDLHAPSLETLSTGLQYHPPARTLVEIDEELVV